LYFGIGEQRIVGMIDIRFQIGINVVRDGEMVDGGGSVLQGFVIGFSLKE